LSEVLEADEFADSSCQTETSRYNHRTHESTIILGGGSGDGFDLRSLQQKGRASQASGTGGAGRADGSSPNASG
jgi:hypothetical protein